MSGNKTRERIRISSIASPGTQNVTIESDSNEPTMPYGFGRQLPNILLNFNELNLPPNPFNIPATVAVANPTAEEHDENYSPQSLEPSEPSPTSTPPMNLCSIEGWDTPHTTTDDNTFYSDDEPRRNYFLPSSPCPLLPTRRLKQTEPRNVFTKKRGTVVARLRGLWTVAPWTEGHTRLNVNKLKTQDWKLHKHILHQFH